MNIVQASLAITLLAAPAAAQDPQPRSLEHKMLLRCSAAFALVARWQQAGNAEFLRYPPLGERGREFFVRASAKVMDEAGLDRDGIEAALVLEAQSLLPAGAVDAVMPACLSALAASER